MDWNELKQSDKVYKPRILKKDERAKSVNGTKMTLSNITRKSSFSPKNIAVRLAKTFSVFDKDDFNVIIKHNDEPEFSVENKLRFENIEIYKEWSFPLEKRAIPLIFSGIVVVLAIIFPCILLFSE